MKLRAGLLVVAAMVMAGCAAAPPAAVKAAARQGCCTNTTFVGRCAPSALVPRRLECLPAQPAAPVCIADPFRCDNLRNTPVDDCLHRDFNRGLNTPCRREVTFTPWDPYGACLKNVCSER